MRLEARIKMGYYPTPLSVVDRIRYFLVFPEDNVNFLDPCCVLKGSYEDARINKRCFWLPFSQLMSGILSENLTAKEKRKASFRGTVKYLQPEGLLIYIVPQKRLCQHRIPFVTRGRLPKFDLQVMDEWIKDNIFRQERFDSLPCEQRATLTITDF